MIRQHFRLLLPTLLLAVATGCAHLPDAPQAAQTAAVTPTRYRNAEPDAACDATPDWVRMFGDDVLASLVSSAQRDNPYTQVARWQAVAAQARVRLARADRLPQAVASAGYSNSRTSETTALGEILGNRSIEGDKFSVGVDLGWQIDAWNRIGAAVEAAQAGELSEAAFAEQVQEILAWEVADHYWRYRLAETEIRLLGAERDRRAEAVAVVEGRFRHGFDDDRALAKARLALAKARAEIETARHRKQLAGNELATLLAQPLAGFSLPQGGAALPDVPQIRPGLPASLLARRPDLRRSVQGLRVLLAQKRIADSAFFPSIRLTSSLGFASLKLRDLAESGSSQFSLGPLVISLPLLDGGRIRASQRVAAANYEAALNEYKVQLLIALREVDDALGAVATWRSREPELQAALHAARAAARAARARFDRGMVNYLVVTRAERDLSDAELALARAHAQGLEASTDLIHALGGGWTCQRPT